MTKFPLWFFLEVIITLQFSLCLIFLLCLFFLYASSLYPSCNFPVTAVTLSLLDHLHWIHYFLGPVFSFLSFKSFVHHFLVPSWERTWRWMFLSCIFAVTFSLAGVNFLANVASTTLSCGLLGCRWEVDATLVLFFLWKLLFSQWSEMSWWHAFMWAGVHSLSRVFGKIQVL